MTRACLKDVPLPPERKLLFENRRTPGAAGAWNSGIDVTNLDDPPGEGVAGCEPLAPVAGEPLALVVGVIADADRHGASRIALLLEDLWVLQSDPEPSGVGKSGAQRDHREAVISRLVAKASLRQRPGSG